VTSVLRMWSCQRILAIWRWHFIWNASKRLVSAAQSVGMCVIQIHLCEAYQVGRYIRDSGAISTITRSSRSAVVLVKTLRHAADDLARSVILLTHGFGFG